jgi:hypothetical protein
MRWDIKVTVGWTFKIGFRAGVGNFHLITASKMAFWDPPSIVAVPIRGESAKRRMKVTLTPLLALVK